MLVDKISELEREKHKLLSELSSSIRESSSPSIESSRSVVTSAAAASTLCTSSASASMASLFATASSVNQIKQERLLPSLANNPQSDSANSSGTNHVHSFDTSNGSMIDQTSVIVSVTSACPLSSVQNCMPRDQTQNAPLPHHPSRLMDENKINYNHDDNINNNHHRNRDDRGDAVQDKSPLIMHTSDDNSSPCRRNFTLTPNDKSQAASHSDSPADSNNEGLVNLKISPPPPSHAFVNKSPCSPSHVHVVVSDSSGFSSPAHVTDATATATPKAHSFVHPHINY